MKLSALASLVWPFLVTVAGLVPVVLLGACDNVTTCGAKTFALGPVVLVVAPVTGFVAGRVSSGWVLGLVAMLAGVASVVGYIMTTDVWLISPGSMGSEASFRAVAFLLLTAITSALMVPGWGIGRMLYDRAHVQPTVP